MRKIHYRLDTNEISWGELAENIPFTVVNRLDVPIHNIITRCHP